MGGLRTLTALLGRFLRSRAFVFTFGPVVFLGDFLALGYVLDRMQLSLASFIQNYSNFPPDTFSNFPYPEQASDPTLFLVLSMLILSFAVFAVFVAIGERFARLPPIGFAQYRAAFETQRYLQKMFFAFIAQLFRTSLLRLPLQPPAFVIDVIEAPRLILSVRLSELLVVKRMGSATAA